MESGCGIGVHVFMGKSAHAEGNRCERREGQVSKTVAWTRQ